MCLFCLFGIAKCYCFCIDVFFFACLALPNVIVFVWMCLFCLFGIAKFYCFCIDVFVLLVWHCQIFLFLYWCVCFACLALPNCAPSWLYLQDCTGMHGQQKIKFCRFCVEFITFNPKVTNSYHTYNCVLVNSISCIISQAIYNSLYPYRISYFRVQLCISLLLLNWKMPENFACLFLRMCWSDAKNEMIQSFKPTWNWILRSSGVWHSLPW